MTAVTFQWETVKNVAIQLRASPTVPYFKQFQTSSLRRLSTL